MRADAGSRQRRLAVLDKLAELGRKIGPVRGDPVAEMREERAQQLIDVLLQEKADQDPI